MIGSRDDQVYMAKLAEQAERYDEMVLFMKVIV
jgi:14-3-3 protein epsilon